MRIQLQVGLPVVLEVSAVQATQDPKKVAFYGRTVTDPQAAIEMYSDSALRQLERHGLSWTSAQGQTLKFEKVAKNGKNFTNIDPAPGGLTMAAAAAAPSAAYAPPPPPPSPYAPPGTPPPPPSVPGMGAQGSQAPPTPSHPRLSHDRILTLHSLAVDHAIVQAKKLDTAEIGSEPASTVAMAATVFISLVRNEE